ncbi:MAG: hypothetical protein AVDCRST_MAG21-922, partial [uncultured Nocardioidaceae bacterium]
APRCRRDAAVGEQADERRHGRFGRRGHDLGGHQVAGAEGGHGGVL